MSASSLIRGLACAVLPLVFGLHCALAADQALVDAAKKECRAQLPVLMAPPPSATVPSSGPEVTPQPEPTPSSADAVPTPPQEPLPSPPPAAPPVVVPALPPVPTP